MRAVIARMRDWARRIRRDVVAVWIAARDPRTPWYARMVALCVAAYALSPIDLIPDFIPVLGYLDDLLIVPAGILLALRLIPPDVLRSARDAAAQSVGTAAGRAGALVIVALWLIGAAALLLWLVGLANHA